MYADVYLVLVFSIMCLPHLFLSMSLCRYILEIELPHLDFYANGSCVSCRIRNHNNMRSNDNSSPKSKRFQYRIHVHVAWAWYAAPLSLLSVPLPLFLCNTNGVAISNTFHRINSTNKFSCSMYSINGMEIERTKFPELYTRSALLCTVCVCFWLCRP